MPRSAVKPPRPKEGQSFFFAFRYKRFGELREDVSTRKPCRRPYVGTQIAAFSRNLPNALQLIVEITSSEEGVFRDDCVSLVPAMYEKTQLLQSMLVVLDFVDPRIEVGGNNKGPERVRGHSEFRACVGVQHAEAGDHPIYRL